MTFVYSCEPRKSPEVLYGYSKFKLCQQPGVSELAAVSCLDMPVSVALAQAPYAIIHQDYCRKCLLPPLT